MTWFDLINGLFEAFGAYAAWKNFFRLRQEREIKGVVWQIWLFYAAWGLWNIIFYPFVGAWFSAVMGAVLTAGNLAWCYLAIQISKPNGVVAARGGSDKLPYIRSVHDEINFYEADTQRFKRAQLFPGLDHPELYGSTENNT